MVPEAQVPVPMTRAEVVHVLEVMQQVRVQHRQAEQEIPQQQAAHAEASSSVEAPAAETVSSADKALRALQGLNCRKLKAAEAALLQMQRGLG